MDRLKLAGLIAIALVAAVAPTSFARAATPTGAGSPTGATACEHLLAAPAHGSAALNALGGRLAQAASATGWSEAKLTKHLKTDPSLWVDSCGHAFYADRDPVADPTPPVIPTLTVSDPFALHSRAGASRVIYLDFDGQLLSGTAWNGSYNGGADFTAPAFDFDGNPGSFSVDEEAVVQSVWQRVAEDYAAFDVDVTTQDPGLDAIDRSGSGDQVYGDRVVITNDSVIFNACQCGGLSYVGVFDTPYSHQYYQPSLVFERGLGYGPKNIAEAASHEAGHSLGLSHEGSSTNGYYAGQGAWAPIMGVGYYEALTQWSHGDYSGANNTEDEFAVMNSHGATYRSDEAGNTVATATALGSDLTASGVINSENDVDCYSFTGSGTTSISADPVSVGPDVDISLDLYDASGTALMHSDPPSAELSNDSIEGLNASVTTTLNGGTYYVCLDGVGQGNPLSAGYDDYGSVGQYRLRVTTSSGVGPLAVTTSTLPQATYGGMYSANLNATGGTMPYTWTIASGSLPASLSLSSTGFIVGTPTDAAGSYALTLRVTDAMGQTADRSLTLVLVDPPLVVTSSSPLPPAQLTLAYSTQLTAIGSRGSYTWSIYSGALPAGLTLTSGGLVSGLPTRTGTYTVTVRVATASATLTKTLTIAVANLLKVGTTTLADGTVGVAYSASLSGSGGVTPYTWTVDSGSLPTGLTLAAGKITGTPTTAGASSFTVRLTDAAGRTTTKALTITVYKVVITTLTAPNGNKGVYYSFQFAATGGKGTYKWSRSTGSLPAGLTLTSAGLLYGTPTTPGTYSFTLKVVDAGNRAATCTYVVVIS